MHLAVSDWENVFSNVYKIVVMSLEQVFLISISFFDHGSIVVLFSVHDGFEVDPSNSEYMWAIFISSALDWN